MTLQRIVRAEQGGTAAEWMHLVGTLLIVGRMIPLPQYIFIETPHRGIRTKVARSGVGVQIAEAETPTTETIDLVVLLPLKRLASAAQAATEAAMAVVVAWRFRRAASTTVVMTVADIPVAGPRQALVHLIPTRSESHREIRRLSRAV